MSKPILPLQSEQYDAKSAQEMLLALVRSVDEKADVYKTKGYLICSTRVFKGSRKIEHEKSLYHGWSIDNVLLKLAHMAKQTTQLDDSQKVSREILMTEYKIHLMPKPNYVFPVMRILMAACKNSDFNKFIFQIKILIDLNDKDELDQVLPRIVIYPSLGLENAEIVLQKVCGIFEAYNLKEISDNLVPRYSEPKNALISFTQGSGDIKNDLLNTQEVVPQVYYSWAAKQPDLKTIAESKIITATQPTPK